MSWSFGTPILERAADPRAARSAVLVVLLAVLALVFPLAAPSFAINDDSQDTSATSPLSRVGSVGLAGSDLVESSSATGGLGTLALASDVDRSDSVHGMLELQAISPMVVRPDDAVTVQVKITNTSKSTIKDASVSLELLTHRFTSRTGIAQWAGQGEQTSLPVTLVKKQEIADPIKAGESVTARIKFAASDLRLIGGLDGWGPRGISVRLGGEQKKKVNANLDVVRSYLLWYSAPADTEPSLSLATTALLTGPAVDPLEHASARATYLAATAPDSRLQHVLSAVSGSKHVSLALDPALISGVSISATTPILEEEGPEVTSIPTEPAPGEDAEGSTGAGTEEPTAGATPTIPTGDSPATDPTPTPAPTAEADQFVPSSEQVHSEQWLSAFRSAAKGRELFALPSYDADWTTYSNSGTRVPEFRAREYKVLDGLDLSGSLAWPTSQSMSTRTVETALDSDRPWVIAEGDSAQPTTTLSYTPDAAYTVETKTGESRVLVSEPTLVSLIEDPGTNNPISARQRFIAELAMIARERPSDLRNIVIAMDRSWNPDPEVAKAQFGAIPALPWVTTTDISAIAAGDAESTQTYTLPAVSMGLQALEPSVFNKLRSDLRKIEDLAGVVADPDALTSPFRSATRAATSVAWISDVTAHDRAVVNLESATQAALDGISVVTGSDINMISTGSEIPVTVQNNLNQDVTIQVRLRPNDVRLQAKDSPTLTIPSGGSESVRVPVTAVGSGNVVVAVEIRDAEGTYAATAGEFNVRVRADWENVGTGVVAALLALLLGGGIWRTVKRGRSERRTSPDDTAAAIAMVEAEAEGGPAADTDLRLTHPRYVADAHSAAKAQSPQSPTETSEKE